MIYKWHKTEPNFLSMIEKGVSEEFTKHCTSIFRELEFPTDRIIVHKDDKQAYKARLLCMTIYQ